MGFKISGFDDFNKAIEEISKTQTNAAMKKSAKKALQITAEKAKAIVPVKDGDLRASIVVSDKLSKAQAAARKREIGKFKTEVFVGPAGAEGSLAHLVEFGTRLTPARKDKKSGKTIRKHAPTAPKPFMRPAWVATEADVLEALQTEFSEAVAGAVKRNRKRIAKNSKGVS